MLTFYSRSFISVVDRPIALNLSLAYAMNPEQPTCGGVGNARVKYSAFQK